ALDSGVRPLSPEPDSGVRPLSLATARRCQPNERPPVSDERRRRSVQRTESDVAAGRMRASMGHSVTPVAREARLLALSMDLLGAAGFDGYLKLHNPAWNRTLGYDDDELASTPYIDLIHPDDQPAAQSVIDRMAGGASTIEFVCRIRRRDG